MQVEGVGMVGRLGLGGLGSGWVRRGCIAKHVPTMLVATRIAERPREMWVMQGVLEVG
jgi:hypothetical protein